MRRVQCAPKPHRRAAFDVLDMRRTDHARPGACETGHGTDRNGVAKGGHTGADRR